MKRFHQTGHSSLLRTILAVNAQALRLRDQVTALSAPRELDDSFTNGIGLASTRPGELAEGFLGLRV